MQLDSAASPRSNPLTEHHSMCGIVGYVGNQECSDILLSGLKRLEYRGYDSAGIAIGQEDGSVEIRPDGRLAHRLRQARSCCERQSRGE